MDKLEADRPAVRADREARGTVRRSAPRTPSGGLLPITVTDGERAGEKSKLPALPLEMDGRRFGIHRDVPRKGQHTREVMAEVGYSDEEIDALIEQGAVGAE